jgi:hypothetical protein
MMLTAAASHAAREHDMATTRKGAPVDDLDAFQQQSGPALDAGTDCAICHAALPDGYRYVCATCAADSARRAEAILGALQGPNDDARLAAAPADAPEADDDLMDCPTCGMALDASGRCAGCVTTVRR